MRLSSNGSATIWVQERIDQSSPELANGNLSLLAYHRALRPNITAAQATWQNQESPYFPDAPDVQSGLEYTFVKSTLTLMYDMGARYVVIQRSWYTRKDIEAKPICKDVLVHQFADDADREVREEGCR